MLTISRPLVTAVAYGSGKTTAISCKIILNDNSAMNCIGNCNVLSQQSAVINGGPKK